jgi:phospholipase/carboxylesterase
MRNIVTASFMAATLCATLHSGAAAQQAGGSPEAMRERLAEGYLRLELALQDARAAGAAETPAERQRINRAFDALTLQFFAGNLAAALERVDGLVAGVPPARGPGESLEQRATQVQEWLAGERRVLEGSGTSTPYLLHVPVGVAPSGGWPIVVAVHGAGGDERMFFGGYGAGIIRGLADSLGLAVVTPRAPLATEAITSLVEHVASFAPVDPARVGLLGHSMGAAVVGRAALQQPARFRGVVCIAGSCGGGSAGAAPPALLIAGGLDPLFRADMLAGQAETLRQGGRSVEFRVLEDEGHTLIVGAALPAAMEWLAGLLGARPGVR